MQSNSRVDRWNAHDERYFEAYTQDASMHGFPATVAPTVEGIRALFRGMWAAFPDIRIEIEHLGVEDEVAAVHFRIRGTHEGEFMGAAPTGNRIDVEVMTFCASARRERSSSAGTGWTRWP